MKSCRILLAAFALTACSLAQTPAAKPAAAPLTPLHELPYTPSLDLKSMDRNADPCADFYQYSCGGWMKNNPIPADKSGWSVYGKLSRENEQFLWGVLEEASRPEGKRDAAQQKIGDYFAACMDVDAIEKVGLKPLQPGLARVAELKSKAALASYLGRTALLPEGGNMFFGFGSNQDLDDATEVIGFVGAGGLGLPDRDYYTKTDKKSLEILARYEKHVAAMLELAGETPAAAAADAKVVLRIETMLAKSMLTRVESRDPYALKHKMTVAELQKLTPGFDWKAYFAELKAPATPTLNVSEPKYLTEGFVAVLKGESLEAIKSYLRWHVVSNMGDVLGKSFRDEHFAFYSKYLFGVEQPAPRWERCVGEVNGLLGEALGQEFVRRTFTDQTRKSTLSMTEEVEAAMAEEIRGLDWMSAATKQKALDKLHALRNKIGYPAKWRDYSSVVIDRNDFAGNVDRASYFESRRQLDKIGKPVDREEWGMTPPTVNAYYNPQMNDINFPAGVLQPPLYDPKMDDAPNYGNTGGTIGHELTHAFDDEGRQFNGEGNLKDWWMKEDAKAFEERINCIRDQYAQYVVVDDIKIQSKLTSGEDVADIGGLLLAWIAWQKAEAGKQLISADGLTPEQRFFVGYAQWACENERPERLRDSAMTNPHSPGKYRVNGVVMNIPSFQQAFGCKAGQPMYKEKVCKVW